MKNMQADFLWPYRNSMEVFAPSSWHVKSRSKSCSSCGAPCMGLFVEFRVRRTRSAFPCFSPSSSQFSNNSSHNYYEEIKLELKRILIYECRCNERLKAKAEASTRLPYCGLRGELEHLKIETRFRGERFESVKGECVI